MDALVDWGLPIVQWIQTFRTPFLDAFFRAVSFLGEENFYIALLPVIYWCLHKALGQRLTILFLVSAYINMVLKAVVAEPRPYEVDPSLYNPLRTPAKSFPSGHAQYLSTTWGFLATQLKTSFWWILAVVLTVLVAISRMYLGDHFPQDVIGGALIGALLVAVYLLLEPGILMWLAGLSLSARLALAGLAPVLLAALYLDEYDAVVLGVLWGGAIGLVLETEWVRFDHRTTLVKQALKLVIGLAVVMGLRIGLKAVLPEGDWFTFLRYGVIGLWVVYGAPWVFVKARLAGQETPEMNSASGTIS